MSENEINKKNEGQEIVLEVADVYLPLPKLVPKMIIRDRKLDVKDAFGGMDGEGI